MRLTRKAARWLHARQTRTRERTFLSHHVSFSAISCSSFVSRCHRNRPSRATKLVNINSKIVLRHIFNLYCQADIFLLLNSRLKTVLGHTIAYVGLGIALQWPHGRPPHNGKLKAVSRLVDTLVLIDQNSRFPAL